MNKHITKLLALLLVCSAGLAAASSDTDLTFISIGGQRNVAERNMLTQRNAMLKGKGMGGTFQALPFLKQSSEAQKLAEALSPVGKQTTSFGSADTTITPDVVIIPLVAGAGHEFLVNVKTNPKHREFGVHLAWQQRLDVLLEGLFFELDDLLLMCIMN